ncbi:MAG: geranylgeranylglyceryl/heptaprenylglyceryl phosphate synthase [Methanobacteriota archaeon]|nr:MAG: geranylgeranylglyceryl/heptaprenylglyceryl phosphate synthase [Euryarchaeota archaeon]
MGLRDPRPPRGRNVYLRRPPLGRESVAVPTRDEVCDDRRAGGSTGVTQDKVDSTISAIKETVTIPVILFPANAANLSPLADALFFMSLLNSRDPRLIVGEQRLAAPVVRAWGLETIPMAYLVVEPGMRAGEVGDADLIPRKTPIVAVQYALAAQMLGMKLVYLEAGSGAPDPVPGKLIRAVKDAVDILVVVGGGIRTPESAQGVTKAGADVVVTGTIIEVAREGAALRKIIAAVKAG